MYETKTRRVLFCGPHGLNRKIRVQLFNSQYKQTSSLYEKLKNHRKTIKRLFIGSLKVINYRVQVIQFIKGRGYGICTFVFVILKRLGRTVII